MPDRYDNANIPKSIREARGYAIPLRGVPQIPDFLHRKMTMLGENSLNAAEMSACDEMIRLGTAEIRRRHEAQKVGMNLHDYFGGDDE